MKLCKKNLSAIWRREIADVRHTNVNIFRKYFLSVQGCQIFLGKTYQNGKNVPNAHNIYQLALLYTKLPLNTKQS
jgi:hypothetical protein